MVNTLKLSFKQQKNIVLITDEIYVKPQLTYQGGNNFGKAINSPNQYATTILTCASPFLVVKCFYFKFYPVYRLDTSFQYNQTVNTLKVVQENGNFIKAILRDNNKVTQKFFNMFDLEKP